MEGIRKRMMRANALNASNQREAYHAEMRLIQQVISPPFLFLLTALDRGRLFRESPQMLRELFLAVRGFSLVFAGENNTPKPERRPHNRKTSRLCLPGSGTAAGRNRATKRPGG